MASNLRNCVIRVDGQVYDDLYNDLIALEVSDRCDEPSSFVLQIAIFRTKSGWSRIDVDDASQGGFEPWQRITILAGYGQKDVLIDGYVAGMAPHIGLTDADCYLLVWGYDASHAMDLEDKVVAWPDKKLSDVATTIFQSYKLTPQVTDTQVVNKLDDQLLIQRGTDWQFLRRLADRVGFEVLVQGGVGIFAPPDLSRTAQKDLAIHFGHEQSNLVWFEPRVAGDRPSEVSMARANSLLKTVETVTVSQSPLTSLGKRDGDALRSGRTVDGKATARLPPGPVLDLQSMTALATGERRRVDWIVTAEGEVDGALYGATLRAHNTVLVKGAGATFSGLYYVTEAIHRITPKSYTQRFRATRNAVDLKRTESSQSQGATPVTVSSSGREVSP